MLKQIEPATGAHLKSIGTDTLSRKQAAAAAGLSKRQKDTALRVANVPDDQFNAAVEGDDPPTVTALAAIGKKTRLVDLGDIPAAEVAQSGPVAQQGG